MKTDVINLNCSNCGYGYVFRYIPAHNVTDNKRNSKCPQCGHDDIVVV